MSRKLARMAVLTGMALVLSGFGANANAGLLDLFRHGGCCKPKPKCCKPAPKCCHPKPCCKPRAIPCRKPAPCCKPRCCSKPVKKCCSPCDPGGKKSFLRRMFRPRHFHISDWFRSTNKGCGCGCPKQPCGCHHHHGGCHHSAPQGNEPAPAPAAEKI